MPYASSSSSVGRCVTRASSVRAPPYQVAAGRQRGVYAAGSQNFPPRPARRTSCSAPSGRKYAPGVRIRNWLPTIGTLACGAKWIVSTPAPLAPLALTAVIVLRSHRDPLTVPRRNATSLPTQPEKSFGVFHARDPTESSPARASVKLVNVDAVAVP
jgi:hypothetical protein